MPLPKHEPEQEAHDVAIFRMVSLLALFAVFVMLICYGMMEIWTRNRNLWWEREIAVPAMSVAAVSSAFDPMVIEESGLVRWGNRQWPRENHDLDGLVAELKTVAHLVSAENPFPIRPAADVRLQRLLDVIGAVQRAGIGELRLLSSTPE